MLVIDRFVGQEIVIGGNIFIRIVGRRGTKGHNQRVRIEVAAAKEILVLRGELVPKSTPLGKFLKARKPK